MKKISKLEYQQRPTNHIQVYHEFKDNKSVRASFPFNVYGIPSG
jgi:hypothetical protein